MPLPVYYTFLGGKFSFIATLSVSVKDTGHTPASGSATLHLSGTGLLDYPLVSQVVVSPVGLAGWSSAVHA